MIKELEKKRNFCCICGNPFPKEGVGIKVPGEEIGTWQCITCSDNKERNEMILNKGPAYISFYQQWDKIPPRPVIYIPHKQKNYLKDKKTYHIMIWED